MSGNNLLIDTNIAIYLLNGDTSLAEILHQKRLYVSFITQLELLGYSWITDNEVKLIEYMLDNCVVIDINSIIKSEVIRLRKLYSLKLPDCIVAATALYLYIPIITADKGFQKVEELNLMFYEK